MPLRDPDARWSVALDPLDSTLRPQLETAARRPAAATGSPSVLAAGTHGTAERPGGGGWAPGRSSSWCLPAPTRPWGDQRSCCFCRWCRSLRASRRPASHAAMLEALQKPRQGLLTPWDRSQKPALEALV